MALYEQVASRLAVDAPKPDLVVYLQAPVEMLLAAHRAARHRLREPASTRPTSTRLNEAYARFFHDYDAAPLLIVNAASIDPSATRRDYEELLARDPAHEARAACTTTRCATVLSERLPGASMYTHLRTARFARGRRSSLGTLDKMKASGEKIACITCYDASFAVLCDDADADLVLVGDSLGMVIQGHDTTVPVTMDDIIYHCKAVARGLHRPFLVADLPFMSYPDADRRWRTPCA